MKTKIRRVTGDELQQVLDLYGKNSKTLGFLPKGAFSEALEQRRIAGAFSDKRLLGYSLFRRVESTGYAAITHLCVSKDCRGQRIGDQLLDFVIDQVNDLFDIRAVTRTDYTHAQSVWERHGFVPRSRRHGRGKSRAMLQTWVKTLNELPLLSLIAESNQPSVITAAIDTNVLIDWVDENDKESKYLLADWLQEDWEPVLTHELDSELRRNSSAQRVTETTSFAATYTKVGGSGRRLEETLIRVHKIMGSPTTQSQRSDRLHIAHAICASVQFFVTRDEEILGYSNVLRDELGVEPIGPADLVAQLDHIRDSAPYRPTRLSGSSLRIRIAEPRDRESLRSAFLDSGQGETLREFDDKVSAAFGDPCRALHVVTRRGTPVGLYEPNKSKGLFRLESLRVPQGSMASRERYALIDQILLNAASDAAASGARAVEIAPSVMGAHGPTPSALRRLGFSQADGRWWKPVLNGVHAEEKGLGLLRSATSSRVELQIVNSIRTHGPESLATLAWPGVVLTSELPTYLLPIRPPFAAELFDSQLAEGGLFGADPLLMFSPENVYYRSPRPFGAPRQFRVLWYESLSVKEVRYTSVVKSVRTAPAKDVFKSMRRLGVLRWSQVRDSAGSPEAPIMALHFIATTKLPSAIPYRRLKELFQQQGSSLGTLAGPRVVPPEILATMFNDECGSPSTNSSPAVR